MVNWKTFVCLSFLLLGLVTGNFSGAKKAVKLHLSVSASGSGETAEVRSGSVSSIVIDQSVRQTSLKHILGFRILELLQKIAQDRRNSNVGKILRFLQIGPLKMHGHGAPNLIDLKLSGANHPLVGLNRVIMRFGPRKIGTYSLDL